MKYKLALFVLMIIALCSLTVLVLKLPAVIRFADISGDDKLATAINGLTAPVIGIVSAILLYLALTRQTEALVKQTESNNLSRASDSGSRERHKIDFIHSLFSQFEGQVTSFFYSYAQGEGDKKKEFTYYGNEGLFRATAAYYQYNHSILRSEPFSRLPWSHRFMLPVRSLEQLRNAIDDADLQQADKIIFRDKWMAYYQCYLKDRMEVLLKAWDEHLTPGDTYQFEIRTLDHEWEGYKNQTVIDILRYSEPPVE